MEGINIMLLKDNIKKLMDNFEEGDALALSEIKDECQNIIQQFAGDPLHEVLGSVPAYIQICARIPSIQTQCVELVKKIITGVEEYQQANEEDKKKALKQIKRQVNKLQSIVEKNNKDLTTLPKPQEQQKEEAKGYTLEDFSHLVDDYKLLQQFFSEATEHLDSAQFVLLELEHDSTNKELINTVFRNFHTIKGSASFLGVKNIEEISHAMEDIFATIRDGKMILTRELVDVIFMALKHCEQF